MSRELCAAAFVGLIAGALAACNEPNTAANATNVTAGDGGAQPGDQSAGSSPAVVDKSHCG